MKVALLFYSLTIKGGGSRQFLQLANYLQDKGNEVTVFAIEYNSRECFPELCKKLNIISLNKDKEFFNHSQDFSIKEQIRNFFLVFKLGYLVSKYDFRLLNPHEWPASWAAVVAKLLKLGKPKIIWMCNDLWHVYNPYIKNYSLNFKLRRMLDVFVTKYFVNDIVVLDNRIKKLVKIFYKKNAKVVRSGIDIKNFLSFKHSDYKNKTIRKKLGIGSHECLLMSFGIFYPQRRFEDAILSVKSVKDDLKVKKDFKYAIIGSNKRDPDYFNKIKLMTNEYKLDNSVKFITSSVSDKELLYFYDSCDVFIFPNDKQTWGLAVIEAMALGKPCVVSTGSGVSEVLTNEENALLVKPRNPSQLALALKKLIENTEDRKKIGINGKKLVLSNFSWEKYSSGMLNIMSKYV